MSENDTETTETTESSETTGSSSSDQPEHASAIGDEQLPEDLVASEDNPLAEGLPPGEDVDVRAEGKRATEMADPEESTDEAEEQHGDG